MVTEKIGEESEPKPEADETLKEELEKNKK